MIQEQLENIHIAILEDHELSLWVADLRALLSAYQAQEKQIATMQVVNAGLHDLLTELHATADLDNISTEVQTMLTEVLAGDDGNCGNAICHRILELEQQVAALTAREPIGLKLLREVAKETNGSPSMQLLDGQIYKVIPTPLADRIEAFLPLNSSIEALTATGEARMSEAEWQRTFQQFRLW